MLVRCAVQEFCTGAVPGLGPWAARTLRLAPSGSLRPRPQPRESALWLVFTGYRRGSPAPPLRVAGCGTRGRLWPTSRADALRGLPCCEWVPLAGSRGCLTGADASLRALLWTGPACGGRPHGRRRFAVRPAATGFRSAGAYPRAIRCALALPRVGWGRGATGADASLRALLRRGSARRVVDNPAGVRFARALVRVGSARRDLGLGGMVYCYPIRGLFRREDCYGY
ncbi:hypothetical protein SAMN02910314_00245 [Denitrobacterium detoxificans]|uniref:Uncharacterized protein n=1 Tax=Denitrobacterium detoxificans TaxID=79604 RepID=A0A1H8PP22_9ACTN|nr:hypothetical protein SAMN02910314_00245 [Denitrobacterium detoxificans]